MKSDLAALRQAAQERDPNQTQFLLKRLFLSLSFYRALAVAVEQVYAYLDTFERYHPTHKWARQVVVQITALGTAPGDIPEEAKQPFATPGTANFVKALHDLAHACRQSNQMEARIGFLVSAVVNAIMAELVEAWYGARLDEWEQVRQNGADAHDIAYRFWTDDEVARRDVAAWLAVADNLDEKIKRG